MSFKARYKSRLLGKLVFSSAIALLCSVKAEAQYILGIATSNWSGTNALYLNPANIADSRERFIVDLGSLNAGIYNNLGTLNNKGGIIGAISNGNTQNIFNYSNNNSFSLIAPYAEIHGPGCMISINHKHSIAITTGLRGMNQFDHFDQSLYRIINDSANVPSGNVDLLSQKFNYTAQVWAQVGATYAGVLYEKGHHQLKAGVTLRYLDGLGYIGLKGNNLDAHYRNGNDSVFVANSDIEFASNILSTRGAVLSGVSNHSYLSDFLNAKHGNGIGGDIGLVYDYVQDTSDGLYDKDGRTDVDRTKNRYKLRLSAAVRDLGSIKYKSSGNSNFTVTGNGYITGKGLSDSVTNYQNFRTYAIRHGFTADTSHQDTKVHQPTALVLGADYNIYKKYYVNVTYVGNLVNRQEFGTSYYNQLTVTPRMDSRYLSVGLPMSYNSLAHNFMLGAGLRYRGFFIGSEDMLALALRRQYGFNFYVGGFVPIYKKTPNGSTPHHHPIAEPDMEHGGSSDTTDNVPDVYENDLIDHSQRESPATRKENITDAGTVGENDAPDQRKHLYFLKQENITANKN